MDIQLVGPSPGNEAPQQRRRSAAGALGAACLSDNFMPGLVYTYSNKSFPEPSGHHASVLRDIVLKGKMTKRVQTAWPLVWRILGG